jgi:hypothetical protein
MQGALIIFFIFVLFPGIILGFILLSRYLRYRETLTMIQHGITLPPPPMPPMMRPVPPMMPRPPIVMQQGNGGTGRGTLIWGLVLSAVGLALTIALWPIGFIANSASGNSVNFPLGLGPWMLAGFVPLFVGLALILGYAITRQEKESGTAPPAPFPAEGWGAVTPAGQPPFARGPIVPPAPVVREEVPEPTAPTNLPPGT